MFSPKSSEPTLGNTNIASNGSVTTANEGTPGTTPNISQSLCRNDEILKRLFSSNPKDWTYYDEKGLYCLSTDAFLQIKEIQSEEFIAVDEPWVKNYSDPSASQAVFAISYDGTEIERHRFAYVDGGRMLIPYPESCTDLRISLNLYLLGKILNYPWNNCYDFDEYLRRANIVTDKNLH